MSKTTSDARLARGRRHQIEGDTDAAEREYRAVLRERPEDAEALALLGFLALQREQPAQAAECIEKALRAQPDDAELHFNLGFALLADGRPAQAAPAYAEAVRLAPLWTAAHNSLGIALQESGKAEAARRVFEQAMALDPESADAPANLGCLLRQQGLHEEAVSWLHRAAELAPDDAELLQLLAEALAAASRWQEAADCLRALLGLQPDSVEAHYQLGLALDRLGLAAQAAGAWRQATELDATHAGAHESLGLALGEAGRLEEALAALDRAVALRPDDDELARHRRELLARQLAPWHFRMLADEGRNDAYRRAIEKVVDRDSIVLDIGTGSGLLAMMAARAGARRVLACELSPPVAAAARDVIRDNGLDHVIEVVTAKSTALSAGRPPLAERATVLVSEIVDVGVLGEGVLPTLRHALAHLVAPGAAVIPAGATVYARLVALPELRRVHPLGELSGFDLSAFDRFRVPGAYQDLDLARTPHSTLSADVEVARYNLRAPPPAESTRRLPLRFDAVADGHAHAVAMWFELHLDDEISLSTRPGSGLFAWGQALQFLEADLPVRAGEAVTLTAVLDDTRIGFEPAGR